MRVKGAELHFTLQYYSGLHSKSDGTTRLVFNGELEVYENGELYGKYTTVIDVQTDSAASESRKLKVSKLKVRMLRSRNWK